MIPNYSKPDDWEKFNTLGVTQFGQIQLAIYVHWSTRLCGTTITILNAKRLIKNNTNT